MNITHLLLSVIFIRFCIIQCLEHSNSSLRNVDLKETHFIDSYKAISKCLFGSNSPDAINQPPQDIEKHFNDVIQATKRFRTVPIHGTVGKW
jgi:hypothetical protein